MPADAERRSNDAHKPARPDDGALQSLLRSAGEGSGPRPVEEWNPPNCGDIGMAIGRDGRWTYRGSPIGRPALVKLFASILRKDDDGNTYLVTPVEKIVVDVADAPFLAVEMAVTGEGRGQQLTFRTNVDDVVTVDADHPLRFAVEQGSGGLKPYIRVRGRLQALVTRALYADLVARAEPRHAGEEALGIWSGGVWWPLCECKV